MGSARKVGVPPDFQLLIFGHSTLTGEKAITEAEPMEKKIGRNPAYFWIDQLHSRFVFAGVDWFQLAFWSTFSVGMLFVRSQDFRNYSFFAAILFSVITHKYRFTSQRHITKRVFNYAGEEVASMRGDFSDFIPAHLPRNCSAMLRDVFQPRQ